MATTSFAINAPSVFLRRKDAAAYLKEHFGFGASSTPSAPF
jgi:hypothetical protein